MTLAYTALFTDLGRLVKYYNVFAASAQALPPFVYDIQTDFQADNQLASIDGLPGALAGWQSSVEGWRDTLAGYAQNRMTDRGSIATILGVTSLDTGVIMSRFIEQMIADAQTVLRSSTVIGTVTAGGSNLGTGTVLVTKLLDRVTSPGSRQGVNFPAHHLYANLNSELTITEGMTLGCVADSFTDKTAEGSESFSWIGGLADTSNGVQTTEGSGNIGTVQGIHANTSRYLANADFETFTVTNTPDSWTIDLGVVTTNVKKATASPFHGAAYLNFLGDGATAAIQVSQPVSPNGLIAGKMYCVTANIKADATIGAGDLTILFAGTGYTAATSEKISVAHGSLPTTWTLENFFVLMPQDIPADMKLIIKWSGTPTNAKNLYVDDLGMDVVNYGGGLGINVVRGATPFVRDDRFTFSVTATEKLFQAFFRRVFGYMLPSLAAANTIDEALAS